MTVKHSSSHWGAIEAHVEDGRLTAVTPFAGDQNPSPIIRSLAGSVYHRSRIDRPMVRASYLAEGPGADPAKRGAEPFVPVSWDKAMALVAAELRRVKAAHGNEAIYGGSYGWGSAGRLHNACSLLHRFLNLFGGFTDSTGSYSCAAAEAVVPHILGDFNQILKTQTDWRSIAENTRLVLAFGGMPPRNSQIAAGGQGNHSTEGSLKRCRENGVEFVYVGPVTSDMADFLGAEWIRPLPNTDTAPDARPRPYAGGRGAAGPGLPRRATPPASRASGPISWARATASRRRPTGPPPSPASRPRPSARSPGAWRPPAP